METRKNTLKKLFILSACVFGLSGCGESQNVESIAFDDNYQSTWKVGEIDFSQLKFLVTYKNGSVETVSCDISMIEESDVYKFYKVGEWKVKINFNTKYYNIVDFVITENEFDSSLKLKDEVVLYDGKSHNLSVEGPLPEGTNVYFPQGNSFTSASEVPYNVKCILTKEGYKTKELTGKLTITKSDYSKEILDQIEFNDTEFTYDGTEKKLEAKNIPQDCSVDYYIGKIHGNSMVNAGVYKVTGVITCSNPNYNQIPNIEATLTINKARYELNDVTFDDAIYSYEPGVKHTLLLSNAKNIPNNVKVTYENNTHEDVGEYEAVARFEVDSNHESIEPMTAVLTVIPKELDLNVIDFKKIQNATFDGTSKNFEIDAPTYVKVTKKYFDSKNIEVSEPVDAGTYQVKISYEISDSLKKENYKLINVPDNSGMLIIQKKILDLSNLNFKSDSYCYDGNGHEFNVETEEEISGQKVKHTVPEELVINKEYYSNGVKMNELPKDIGEYVVKFDTTFKPEVNGKTINSENYTIVNEPSETGVFNIVKNKVDLSNLVLNDQSKYYNRGNQIEYDLEELPESVNVAVKYYFNQVEVEKVTEVGTYEVSITFSLNKEKGYSDEYYELVGVPKNVPSLVVQKKPIDLTGVEPTDVVVSYTGLPIAYDIKNIINFAKVSEYVQPVFEFYDDSGKRLEKDVLPVNKGVYSIKVSFALNPSCSSDSYNLINNRSYYVTMTIK
ncbi:MAG: MBG domain-containing protein [Bacilli bacterium]|nr:MBG domain-containing protein [Bacilli bacterium]